MEKFKRRKQILIAILIGIGIILSIPLIIGILHKNHILLFLTIFSFVFICFGAAYLYKIWIKLPYKTDVVKPIIESIHSGITYEYHMYGGDYKSLIKSYKLIPYATSFDFNDIIHEKGENFVYTSFDLIASHTQGSGKSSHTVIDFQGKVYDIPLGKTYCNYILKEEAKDNSPEGFTHLDLELIDFNEKFDLYTTDLVEIYKIFTPKRIKACQELEFFADKKSIICHIDEHLYIFLANKENQFESFGEEAQILEEYENQLRNLKKYLKVFTS